LIEEGVKKMTEGQEVVEVVVNGEFDADELGVSTDFAVRILKGRTAIVLPYNAKRKGYIMPEKLEKMDCQMLLHAAESGGGMTNTGYSTIICGLSGKALRPYVVHTHGHLSNGTHAEFWILSSYIKICASKKEQDLDIVKMTAEYDEQERVIRVSETQIWHGFENELPKRYNRYADAVSAAVDKADCYHCREPHYIA
jgi:hypothetical protein